MKIAYLANAGSVHFVRWYEYFIGAGHEVHLISGDTSLLEYSINIKGIKVYYLPEFKFTNRKISFIINILNLLRILSRLKRLLKDISPDIIHAHQVHPYGFWGALSGFHPFILTPAGSDVVVNANKYYIYKKIAEFVLRNADMVTGDSLVLKENCEKFGLQKEYHLIQNGVNLDRFIPTSKDSRALIREKYGISDTTLLLFYARGFTKLYNVEQLIKAMPLILEKMPDCKLMLAHHFGEMREDLKGMVESMNLSDFIIFTGLIYPKDMMLHFHASDIFVSTPKSDNSPSSVYEAMACGVPTIINDLPWTKYAMKHQSNTYIINEASPGNIADAILQISNNEKLKVRIIKGGLETVKKYFCYHENMKRMEELMMKLSN